MTNIFKVFISFIFLTIFSFSIANAKVRWCVVHNMTGKISTCFSNKLVKVSFLLLAVEVVETLVTDSFKFIAVSVILHFPNLYAKFFV